MNDVIRWAISAAAAPKSRPRTPVDAQPIDRRVRELFERARSTSRPEDLRRSDQELLIRYAILGCAITSVGAVLLRKIAAVLQ